MRMTHLLRVACAFLFTALWFVCVAMAQTETATVSGLITDETGAVVPGAEVKLQSVDRGTVDSATTNNAGIYVFASVHPGRFQLTVHKPGFKQVDFLGLIVNVQDHIEQNFRLQIGSVAESVTVEASAATINTQDAAVSTVVDRQFAENLPMNGRSFQTLIQLTPGVVLTASTAYDSGQFSVNGQRATANYWMVDGVSANIGASSSNPGDGFAGALGSFSALGGTNSLVSVDALQEFRIETSSYAPEFGRTSGGQILIVTRSGTNQFHGTAFNYLRNDVFDASNWFNGYTNNPPLPKAKDRQNDFGGTFGGPISKDRTFFFFSYEGLRLRLPGTSLTTVPDTGNTPGGLDSRQTATSAIQPFLNAFPEPNGPEVLAPCNPATDPSCPPSGQKATGAAKFGASFSNPATLDAYSLRVDHRVGNSLSVFGRYNYSPSEIIQRGSLAYVPLSSVARSRITTQTGTLGATWTISPSSVNDFRFNYSRTNADSHYYLDDFGSAVPLTSLPFPVPYRSQDSLLTFGINSLQGGYLTVGRTGGNLQRQFNVVNSVSLHRGTHSIKFGVDFRRLMPVSDSILYSQEPIFLTVPAAETGNPFLSVLTSGRKAELLFHNLGAFAQDTWHIGPRFTLTYGLRWDVDFAPSAASEPNIPAITGYNLSNLSNLALAPPGTAPFNTTYANFAPRLGVAYQLSTNQNWATVLRGGFGVFFDLATQEAGNNIISYNYPFGAETVKSGGTFPFDSTTAAPPQIVPPGSGAGTVYVFDPHLQLPYTLQWNIAFQQGLGPTQTVTMSYLGSVGRRLTQSAIVLSPNSNFGSVDLVGNTATSDYSALQIQFQRHLTGGLQALASYSWSHSLDDASAGSYGNASNGFVPAANRSANRGPSDFDIRNAFSAGLTYNIPGPKRNPLISAITRGWSVENIVQARSAPPVDVYNGLFYFLLSGAATNVRPDLVSGIPLYLYGSQYPGGRVLNNTPNQAGTGCIGPFCPPPTDATGVPLRQGNLGRNALRGFGAAQWDFAIHRDFPIHELLKLQFRAEIFNLLNHPNFAPPDGNLFDPSFGLSTQMLGQFLSGGNVGGGGFSPLYQIGGPRSIQLALKLSF